MGSRYVKVEHLTPKIWTEKFFDLIDKKITKYAMSTLVTDELPKTAKEISFRIDNNNIVQMQVIGTDAKHTERHVQLPKGTRLRMSESKPVLNSYNIYKVFSESFKNLPKYYEVVDDSSGTFDSGMQEITDEAAFQKKTVVPDLVGTSSTVVFGIDEDGLYLDLVVVGTTAFSRTKFRMLNKTSTKSDAEGAD